MVADSRVSWRHGVLRIEGDGWLLEDVGSTNGTFVGLQRIERVPIAADCVVRLGNPDDGPVLRCMLQAAVAAARRTRWQRAGRAARAGAACRCPSSRLACRPAGRRSRPQPAAPAARLRPAPARPSRRRRAGAQAVPRDLLPSVDRRPTSRMPLPAKALRIGRIPDNDLVLRDLDVSRHHAELRKSSDGAYEIVDLGSHNGTFVNGRRVSSAVLSESDIVSIGRSTFRLAGGELRQFVDDGEITFTAQDLVVKVGGGKVLLNHVTFPIPEKSLVGVIGPSGAGKSTLLGALTGMRPADTGTVLYDNRDLYRNYAELRYRIGLVPQESVLHTQLTARRALRVLRRAALPGRHRGARARRPGR